MGNATLGSPTLTFSMHANGGSELAVGGLKTPISLTLELFEKIDPATTCVGPPRCSLTSSAPNPNPNPNPKPSPSPHPDPDPDPDPTQVMPPSARTAPWLPPASR